MNHPHPFVFLRGLDSNLVAALVNFLYMGETSICKEELEQFLRAAEDLKLLGLSGGTDSEDQQSSKYTEDVDKGITIEEKKAKRYKKFKKEEAAFDMSVPKMAEGDVGSPSQESVKSVFFTQQERRGGGEAYVDDGEAAREERIQVEVQSVRSEDERQQGQHEAPR